MITLHFRILHNCRSNYNAKTNLHIYLTMTSDNVKTGKVAPKIFLTQRSFNPWSAWYPDEICLERNDAEAPILNCNWQPGRVTSFRPTRNWWAEEKPATDFVYFTGPAKCIFPSDYSLHYLNCYHFRSLEHVLRKIIRSKNSHNPEW